MSSEKNITDIQFFLKKNGILEKSIKSLEKFGLNTWDLQEEILTNNEKIIKIRKKIKESRYK